MHTQNTTHKLKLIVDCEEKGRGIGHFQSYMHAQNKTHLLKLIVNWEENGEMHWSLPVIHAHTKQNSPPEVDSGLGGKRERHWSLLVIQTHTKHNSQAEVDS